ncbi:MAG: SDR family oxidoreductase [Candidatus Hodarchaeales archaeon]|jgi:chlorophyll(ide) b reductase
MNIVCTGNTKGIGLALTKEFLKFGDNLIISSRKEQNVLKIHQTLQDEFPESNVFPFVCDVRNEGQVHELAEFANKKMGTIDIWINNAGTNGSTRAPIDEIPLEEIREIIDTNILGVINGCKAALSIMKPIEKGHIFNMAGWGSDGRTSPLSSPYGASKATIPQFTSTIAEEFKNSGVGFHTLSPGMVMTGFILKHITPDNRRVFNIIAEYPEIVAAKLVPKIRQVKGTNQKIRHLSRVKVMWRFFTFWKRKGRFFDANGEFIPFSKVKKEREKD